MHQIFLSVGKFADFVTEFSRGDPGKIPKYSLLVSFWGIRPGDPPGPGKSRGPPCAQNFPGKKMTKKMTKKWPQIFTFSVVWSKKRRFFRPQVSKGGDFPSWKTGQIWGQKPLIFTPKNTHETTLKVDFVHIYTRRVTRVFTRDIFRRFLQKF